MTEIFTFAPTAYEAARIADSKRTTKQRQAAARRKLKQLERCLVGIYWKLTGGGQRVELQRIVDYCESESIDVPVWVKWRVLLHDSDEHTCHQ